MGSCKKCMKLIHIKMRLSVPTQNYSTDFDQILYSKVKFLSDKFNFGPFRCKCCRKHLEMILGRWWSTSLHTVFGSGYVLH
jgi:hypothetical protein